MTNQADSKKRPAWIVVLRGSGALAVIGCLICIGGMLGQSLEILQIGYWAVAAAAIGVVGSVVTYVATR